MFARSAIALVLVLAPVRASGAGADASSLAARAAKTARRATSAIDPAVAAIAAFEAHNLWQKAYQADDDEGHLCAARSLLAKICARKDLDPSHRPSLERSRDALAQLRCGPPKRRRGTPGSARVSAPSSDAQRARVQTIAVQDRHRPLVQIDLRPERRASLLSEDHSALGAADAPDLSEVVVEQTDLPVGLDRAQPQPQALLISGGVSLTLGLVALGVMTPFASRDATYAREIRSLTAIKDGAGGALTEAQDERLTHLMAESRSTFRTSLALGVSGGAMTLLGASLLIAGHRRSARSLALSPCVNRNSAALTLQGHF